MWKIVKRIILAGFVAATLTFAFQPAPSVEALDSDVDGYWICVMEAGYNPSTNMIDKIDIDIDEAVPECASLLPASINDRRIQNVNACLINSVWITESCSWQTSNCGAVTQDDDNMIDPPGGCVIQDLDSNSELYVDCMMENNFDPDTGKVKVDNISSANPPCENEGNRLTTDALEKANSCLSNFSWDTGDCIWSGSGCNEIGLSTSYKPTDANCNKIPTLFTIPDSNVQAAFQCLLSDPDYFNPNTGEFTLPFFKTSYMLNKCFEPNNLNKNQQWEIKECASGVKYNYDNNEWGYNRWGKRGKSRSCEVLGISLNQNDDPDTPKLDAGIKDVLPDDVNEVSCWMSKDGPDVGPNLTNIWLPGNFLPLMYNCKTTTDDGRPIPLHPINLWPIAVRMFGFMVSLLIWLTIVMTVIYGIMFATSVATGTLKLVRNALFTAIFVVLFIIFLYLIVNAILGVLGLNFEDLGNVIIL